MQVKRIMIAAPKSGSGKTTVTCALLQALKDSGLRVAACKCGPDYIDPMFHEEAMGICSKNLDTFFTGTRQTQRLFWEYAAQKDFVVMEGVMGLYDGLGGVREEGSSYHLAQVTKTPIVLVVDAKGMGRSLLALLSGFLSYDKDHLICGILLNRISPGYYKTIKPLIERELNIGVVGFLQEKEEFRMESRHLGLVLPSESGKIAEKLQVLARTFLETVSLERIHKIACGAEEFAGKLQTGEEDKAGALHGKAAQSRAVIAVAWDEAFCFYYGDNIRMLKEYGADITYFSPLHDEALPKGCHGLVLGGGYPELYAKRLSENQKMREAVRHAIEGGMPVVAECGGFLYLHDFLVDGEKKCHPMAGVIPASCFDTQKSVRFGYVEIAEKKGHFLPEGETIKGHEFHYYDSTCNGSDATAVKPVTGKKYDCVIADDMHWMGFPHLYYPSNPAFPKAFVAKAAFFKKKRCEKYE